MYEIARDLAVVPMMIVNAYIVGSKENWVLVDSGTPGSEGKILDAVAERFGSNVTPKAILLTHGHFDHAGSSGTLSNFWDVPVYAHRMDRPYLSGQSKYPPMDPTAPGFFSAVGRLLTNSSTVNLHDRLTVFEDVLPEEVGLSEWQVIHTPGHTPGHVSLFRESDRVLLAGDAFATVNMDNGLCLLTKRKQISRPPVPATYDWRQTRESVHKLAALKPWVIGAGHGVPMQAAARELTAFAADFPTPRHGRYVSQPARFDENGITYLPPAPPDNAPKIAAAVVAVAVAGVGVSLLSRKRL